ncbi:GRF zinc finger / Zinc knuckle protein [Striga asiatica]|uniref:GRF zinc finger / Zinc knuckle protein n=1 Tax=Striga asiatica TaxID=4170 RepID=A0A5A7QAV5_STRAF|nr:GRF zinc finger / Zinc knuckle protein [Striga asiatica]
MAGLWSDHFPASEKTPTVHSPRRTTGVWSELFPSAEKPPSPAATPPPPPPTPLLRSQKFIFCPTCSNGCRIQTSKTLKNPNRQFYTCPVPVQHKFYKWADEVSTFELIDVPYCGCSAGVCRVRKERRGPNAGRILFMCRIKEGEGSCGYKIWQDELENSAVGRANANLTSSQSPKINTNLSKPTLTEENIPSNEFPLTGSLHPANCHRIESKATDQSQCQEIEHEESPRRVQSILDNGINLSKSPSPMANGNHVKPANSISIEEIESPEIESSVGHVTTTEMMYRKTEQLKCQDNKRDALETRAQMLSDLKVSLFQSPTCHVDHAKPAYIDLVEEKSDEAEGNELPEIGPSENLHYHQGVSSDKTEKQKCQENQPHKSSRRPHKRSRHGGLKVSSSTGPLAVSSSLVPSQPVTIPAMNSVSVKQCWMAAAISQNLSIQLEGWWGRLAFHPMPSLTTHASKSLNCYISLQDPTFPVQDKILINNPDKNGQLSHINSFPTTNPQQPSPNTPNPMSAFISRAFSQAANQLKHDFLCLLQKTDPKDHKTMRLAAQDTFSALDLLLSDNRDLRTRAEEYIFRASALAEIEKRDELHRELVEQWLDERRRLDEMGSVQAEAVESAGECRRRIERVREKVSSAMEWIFQVEAELSCYEVEMKGMEKEIGRICEGKKALEEKYATVGEELERSKEVMERKEAAKAAFEQARRLLLG